MDFKCSLLLFASFFLVGVVHNGDLSSCGAGWFEVQGRCYVVIPVPSNFVAAIALCKTDSFGGDMVEFETKAEKDAVIAVIRNTYELIFTGQLFWVGAKGAKHVFLWNSGLPLTYIDFIDGGEGIGCLAFGKTTMEMYKVSDCLSNQLVICEKSGNQTTTSGPQIG